MLTTKKHRKIINELEFKHIKEINELSDKYNLMLDNVCDVNYDLRLEINELKIQLDSLNSNKLRYLKMIESKKFKSKRLKKKYKDKLIREITILFGGEKDEF